MSVCTWGRTYWLTILVLPRYSMCSLAFSLRFTILVLLVSSTPGPSSPAGDSSPGVALEGGGDGDGVGWIMTPPRPGDPCRAPLSPAAARKPVKAWAEGGEAEEAECGTSRPGRQWTAEEAGDVLVMGGVSQGSMGRGPGGGPRGASADMGKFSLSLRAALSIFS